MGYVPEAKITRVFCAVIDVYKKTYIKRVAPTPR
jgi:hypothetical protein